MLSSLADVDAMDTSHLQLNQWCPKTACNPERPAQSACRDTQALLKRSMQQMASDGWQTTLSSAITAMSPTQAR